MPVSTTPATGRSTAHDHDDATTQRDTGSDARHEVAAAIDTVRAAAADVGQRVPDMIQSVRAPAADGIRSIQALPEPTQRLLGVFSLGLGVGLMVAGAPRLLVGGALLPALGVAASVLGRGANGTRKPA